MIVGGGYIGFEFAHIAARAGAGVTILNRGPPPLTGFDPDPSAVFTLPPLARVGLLEAEAGAQGLAFQVKHERRARLVHRAPRQRAVLRLQVLVEEGSGRILGAHLIGPDAAEVINLFGFAMRSGLTAGAIRHATFAYPTAASDIASMLP